VGNLVRSRASKTTPRQIISSSAALNSANPTPRSTSLAGDHMGIKPACHLTSGRASLNQTRRDTAEPTATVAAAIHIGSVGWPMRNHATVRRNGRKLWSNANTKGPARGRSTAIDECQESRKIGLTNRVIWRGERYSNHVVESRGSIVLVARWPSPKRNSRVRMDVQ